MKRHLQLFINFWSECQLIAHNLWFLVTLLTLITSFSAEVGSCFIVKKTDNVIKLLMNKAEPLGANGFPYISSNMTHALFCDYWM